MAYYYLSHGSVARDVPRFSRRIINPLKWARSYSIALAVATVIAIACNFLTLYYRAKAEEVVLEEPASKVIVVAARPSAAPTPTPTVTGVRLYASGAELSADGFTTYVEDRPVEISVKVEPKLSRPPVYWSVSDETAAVLVISEDGTSCKFSAVKPAGKIELKVSCYGAETVIPVYLWER